MNFQSNSQLPLATDLLSWYDKHQRQLPWRKIDPDPYGVWLSEMMLQQTTVTTTIPYYLNFLRQWSTIESLAAASLDEILHAWQGLGYYARARNLHKCAKLIKTDYNGYFPSTISELRKLPGVGPYTAAAVASIAFNIPVAVVDGNVLRIISRILALDTPKDKAYDQVEVFITTILSHERPGDFAQAMMDLGSAICTPRAPKCDQCPWQGNCEAYKRDSQEKHPVLPEKKKKPTRYGIVLWQENDQGQVLLRRRPLKGLLGGMIEVPSTDWRTEPWELPELPEGTFLSTMVRHTFTHFHLNLRILKLTLPIYREGEEEGFWVNPDDFGVYALPTLMKKVIKAMENKVF